MTEQTGPFREQIVTVLAIDMVDFAVVSERIAPEQAFDVLAEQMGTISEAVTKAGGYVDHFYGDGLICFFINDDQTSITSQNQKALECAADLQRVFIERATEKTRVAPHKIGYLPLRIGINTSQMHIGKIKEFGERPVLVGLGLHFARRLVQNCEPCMVMLSSSTFDFLNATDRLSGPVKRRYIQMQAHGEVVMAYEFNPFGASRQKLDDLMREHMTMVGAERREERWPAPAGTLAIEFEGQTAEITNFSLRGFAFDSKRYLAPGITLNGKIIPGNPSFIEELKAGDLQTITLEIRWGYPKGERNYRHGVQIKNLSTTQCMHLNNILRRAIQSPPK